MKSWLKGGIIGALIPIIFFGGLFFYNMFNSSMSFSFFLSKLNPIFLYSLPLQWFLMGALVGLVH